jgi:pimeloyl-ACP methyl ester carboxylesterase
LSDISPTEVSVVLVHGAFADSSGWNGVVSRLISAGVTVRAVPNPLRGLAHDAAYVTKVVSQIPGRVLAVGHCYGGAVITNASLPAGNVIGLVYVAGSAPDEGEALQDIEDGSKDRMLNTGLIATDYPVESGNAPEFWIATNDFRDAFCADLPEDRSHVLALTQRPAARACFYERSASPAWRELPSWAVVPTGDRAAGTDALRAMAKRAGAKVTEVEGSHLIIMSQPGVVTDVILEALAGVTG